MHRYATCQLVLVNCWYSEPNIPDIKDSVQYLYSYPPTLNDHPKESPKMSQPHKLPGRHTGIPQFTAGGMPSDCSEKKKTSLKHEIATAGCILWFRNLRKFVDTFGWTCGPKRFQLAPFDPLQPAEKTTIIFNPLKGILLLFNGKLLIFSKLWEVWGCIDNPPPSKRKNPPDQTPKTLP